MSTYTLFEATGDFATGRPGSQVVETGPQAKGRWTFGSRAEAEAARPAFEERRHKIETARREVLLLHNYAGVASGGNVNSFRDDDWAAVYDRAAGYDESIVPRQVVKFVPRNKAKKDRLLLGNRVGRPEANVHTAMVENAKKKMEWVICQVIDGKDNAVVLLAHGVFESAQAATVAGEQVADRLAAVIA